MSATIDAGAGGAFLGGCPIVEVPGRAHPLDDRLRAGETVAARWARCWPRTRGSVLCFLPGAPEIRRAHGEVARVGAATREVVDLFGGARPPRSRTRDRGPSPRRAGARDPRDQHRRDVAHRARCRTVDRHRAAQGRALRRRSRAIDRLEMERVSQAAPISAPAAPGGSGRAARGGCGTRAIGCARSASRTSRASISPGRCSTCSRGAAIPRRSNGSTRRRATRSTRRARCSSASARSTAAALTALGRRCSAAAASASRPHPDRGATAPAKRRGRARCSSERHFLPARHEATTCDLLGSLDAWATLPPHVHQVARQLEDLAAGVLGAGAPRAAVRRGRAAAGDFRRLSGSCGAARAPQGRRCCWRPGMARCSARERRAGRGVPRRARRPGADRSRAIARRARPHRQPRRARVAHADGRRMSCTASTPRPGA